MFFKNINTNEIYILCISLSLIVIIGLVIAIIVVFNKKSSPSSTFEAKNVCAKPDEKDPEKKTHLVINLPNDKQITLKNNLINDTLNIHNQCNIPKNVSDKYSKNICKFYSIVDGNTLHTHGNCDDLKKQLNKCGINKNDCSLYNLCCKNNAFTFFMLELFLTIFVILLILFSVLYLSRIF
jgi:hypothetical protein